MRKVIATFLLMIISIVTCTAANFAVQPYPIEFDQVPLSQTVLAGANVSFSCSAVIVDEQTLPRFVWYHNNTEITNGNISYTEINMSTLFISNATKMDQGEYYCVVKDWETRTKSESGKLTVYSHDPSVTNRQHLNVTSNETLILKCDFEGIEPGMIQWFRNGKWFRNGRWIRNGNSINLLNKNFYQLQDGSLVVLHANSSDDGEYSCEATINGGHIKLLSYKILTTQVAMDTIQINEAVMLYPENSTHFTTNMTIVCKIPSSLLKVYNVTWTRNGTAISLATEDTEVVEPNLLQIRDMDVSSNEYRCVVFKNSSDKSPIVSPPLVIYKYSVPAVEHSNTTDYYICANLLNSADFSCVNGSVQTVNLYCNSVGGIPTPTVTWYHNGAEIINANVLNGTLMLNDSACNLLGTYQCVVSNEVGSRITVFRVLPFGWPNAPDMPILSTKGRILYVNWEIPLYLGGLNSSSISFEPYKTDNIYKRVDNLNNVKDYDCDSVDNQCNLTVPYNELRSGIEKFYYVNMIVIKSTNGMCQRYNTPVRIKSMESSIDFTTIVEYGPPKVNLHCPDDEGYASMTSQPTGSLSSSELWKNYFVEGCEVYWTCTDGTGNDYHEVAEDCNYDFKFPWRSHNCSVDVIYKYVGLPVGSPPIVMPKVSEYCISHNYAQEPNSSITLTENTDIIYMPSATIQSEIVSSTQDTFSTITTITIKTTSVTSLPTTSQVTPTLSSMLISRSSSVDTFTSLSVTANQDTPLTPTLSPSSSIRNGYGTSLVDSSFTIVVITLSVAVSVVIMFIIIIGLFCCKIRKEQTYKFNMTKRGLHCSLDSIPKAYSYIGREDQSTCEKPNQNIVSWINSLDDSEEITSINSDDLSNEQMLDALYGVTKTKQVTAKKSINAKQGSTFIIEDCISTISASTLLTDDMHKFGTRVSSDIPTTNSNSTPPVVIVEHTIDCQKALARRSEMQNNASSCSHSLKSNISDNSQMLTKSDMKSEDACQYVSLSNKSKKRSVGTDFSDHGEYIEYDDIAKKRTKS